MKKTPFTFCSIGLAIVTLVFTTACETQKKAKLLEKDGHYWQRVDTTSAIYLRGPKAQQRLNMSISDCVVGVKELERLGAVTKAIPGKDMDTPSQSELSEFETPERVGFERREYLDFHDFESCMFTKGWERVEFVPYDVAENSLDTFKRVHTTFSQPVKTTPHQRGDFDTLND